MNDKVTLHGIVLQHNNGFDDMVRMICDRTRQRRERPAPQSNPALRLWLLSNLGHAHNLLLLLPANFPLALLARSIRSINRNLRPLGQQIQPRVTTPRNPLLVKLGDRRPLHVDHEEFGALEGGFAGADDGDVGAVHVVFAVAGGVDPGPGDFEFGREEERGEERRVVGVIMRLANFSKYEKSSEKSSSL